MRSNQTLLVICFLWIFSAHAQQSLIDSLETVVALNHKNEEMVKALNTISYEYMKRDIEKAKKYAWRAKVLSTTLQNNKTLGTSYSNLINIHKNTANRDSSKFYLETLKNLAAVASEADWDFINQNYNSTAGLYFKTSGKIKEALPYLLKGYEYAKKRGNVSEISGQAINIGNCYGEFPDYNKSLEYYLIALNGFESINHKSGLAFCYNNIANCYFNLGHYKQALSYNKKSVNLKKELGDKRGLANSEQTLGSIYMELGDLDKAEKHLKNSITINKELNNVPQLVINYYNLGRILTKKGDEDRALSYLQMSKQLAIKNQDSTLINKIELEILATSKKTVQQQESEKEALFNIKALKDAGIKDQEAFGYKNLSDYYTQTKQFEKALEYNNKYTELMDSLKNKEIHTRFKTIEEQYNKEKNEKQIMLLQKDQAINEKKLNRQRFLMIIFGLIIFFTGVGIYMFVNRNRLKQRMQELELRNSIAADLHDEVGSSLSSIYMLSQMAGKNQFDAKGEIMEKIKTNAHETMERMGDIVWMIKPIENEGEGLKYRMERFVHEICNAQNITCTFLADDLNEVKLNMIQKKNVYLIFKEAVNNAVKYSETKKLDIKIKQQNIKLEMEIKDFGKGFHEKTVLKGNGLDNMKYRATELNGNLKFDSSPERGTTVQLSFPI